MNKNISRLVTALQDMVTTTPATITGQFWQSITVKCGKATITNAKIDMEFTIPFDDDTEANEAEIVFYNLSQTTIAAFKHNSVITVTAGYKNDTGVIFSGRISLVKTKFDTVDKKTTVYAVDDVSLKEKNIENISYSAGVKASYILKDLVGKLKLPIAVFSVRKDMTMENETSIDGGLMESIRSYAETCGVSAYICKGNVYVQDIRKAKHINFTVSENTGLIGMPEEFSEEVEKENYSETIKGYNVTMLLQHRMQTGAVINLKSKNVNGAYAVRSGQHTYDGTNFLTEIEVIE